MLTLNKCLLDYSAEILCVWRKLVKRILYSYVISTFNSVITPRELLFHDKFIFMTKLANFYASIKVFVSNFREKLVKFESEEPEEKNDFLFVIFIFELFK